MRRFGLAIVLVCGLLTPGGVEAQLAGKMWRIGFLIPISPPDSAVAPESVLVRADEIIQ